jgi:hypothetical protein
LRHAKLWREHIGSNDRASRRRHNKNRIEGAQIMTRQSINEFLGRAWASKVRRQARNAGIRQAAANLRKQGVGLATARLLLLGRM